jgi:hypothetical protein
VGGGGVEGLRGCGVSGLQGGCAHMEPRALKYCGVVNRAEPESARLFFNFPLAQFLHLGFLII